MRKTTCHNCGQRDFPLNSIIKVDGKIYCDTCFEAKFPDKKHLEKSLVEREIDPTICANCDKDFGTLVLDKMSAFPICENCHIAIKNKTFPTWVKGFLVGLLVIIIGSFIWNWKYFEAYNGLNQTFVHFENGDFNKASQTIIAASSLVPESEDMQILVSYFKGTELLINDKSEEALIELKKCNGILPDEYNVNVLILQAKTGSAFDTKNYEEFLEVSKQSLALDTTSAISYIGVASAYACLYAQNNTIETKENALEYLKKAKAIDSTSDEIKEYLNRIEYRIYSKNIITGKEFLEKYPNGWKR